LPTATELLSLYLLDQWTEVEWTGIEWTEVDWSGRDWFYPMHAYMKQLCPPHNLIGAFLFFQLILHYYRCIGSTKWVSTWPPL